MTMAKSRRRAIIISLLVLYGFLCADAANIHGAGISLQNAPAIEFRLEGGRNPEVEAGQDFWAVFTVLQEDGHKRPFSPLSKLVFFQCGIEFNPKLIEPVAVEPGGMVTAKGWTAAMEWDKTRPAGMVRVSLKGPKNEKDGLSGYGALLRIRFRTLPEAGGPASLRAKPEKYVLDRDNLFAFTGLALNVRGEDSPVRGPGYGPGNGLGGPGLTIVPVAPRITVANCSRQTVRVSLDRTTGAAFRNARWHWTLHALGAGANDWIVLPIDEAIPLGRTDFVLQLAPGAKAGFARNDKLRLFYTAERVYTNGGGRQTLAGETPVFLVSPDEQPPEAEIGHIQSIGLTYQGKERKSYSSKTPPTIAAKNSLPGSAWLDWTWVLFGPDGSCLNVWAKGPFDLCEGIPIDPAWPDGEYRLLLAAFWADYTRTSFSTASIRFAVRQND